jgi:iron complex outermembrane receptor protein
LAALILVLPAWAEPVLKLRVVDALGSAVPGARVEAFAQGARSATGGITDLSGRLEIAAQPPLTIRVEVRGFEPAAIAVEAAQAGELTLKLQPAIVKNSIEVVVRDEPVAWEAAQTDAEIERGGARTVFDAVEQLVPGAFVTRRGVMGYGIATNGTGTVSVRGVGGQPNTGVLIVVDGRPDMQGLMGHPLPDFYSLSDAGTLSVTEGPASVLYGSNAMGGVIEIKPSSPRPGFHTRLSSSLGSYLTSQNRLAHSGRWEKFYYSGAAGYSRTSGDRPSSAFRQQDGSLNLGYTLSPAWRTSLEGRYGYFHVEDPGPLAAPLANRYANVGRGGYSFNLDNSGGRTWGYLRVFQSFGKHYITDGFRSTDHTTGFRVKQDFALGKQLILETGSEAVNYGGQARNLTQRVNYGGHDILSAAGFSRLQWTLLTRLRLHAGLRYDHDSVSGNIAVPEAGVSYTLKDGYALAAAMGRGFRNPTIRELYLFPAPNPSLKPEKLWNYQASFQARPVSSVSASLTAYYADLSNMIVTLGRFPNLSLNNQGQALNRGLEANVKWRPAKRVSLTSGYAYLRSTNLAPYVPASKWNYSAEFDAGRAFIHVGGMWVGERWADAGHTSRLAAYTLGTLRVTVPIRKNWSLFTTVDNLFNQSYQVVPGYPMPGINAAGGFTVSF